VLGQPLQLMATGGVNYLWTPNTWLNNPAVQKPISKPQNNIRYTVTATSVNGCTASDYIDVIVYRLAADMYVPKAFTPNGDGNNDVFRPILLGMKELRLFRVYNRFGQLLFETKQIGKGWDGTFKGRGQDPATYVWYAEAVSYTDEVKFKKGYVVLIRE
jgi:gliding motility-associated-like protein